MSTESWLKNGVCRCCLFEGAFTSLEETFKAEPADITLTNFLKDTLDIDISLVSDNAATKLNTICDDCLQRLWDAALFKKQVLECEKKFSNIYNNGTDSDIEIKKDYKEEWVIGFDDSNDEDEKTDDKYSDDIHIIHVSNEDDDDDIKLESKYTDDEKLEDEQIIQIVTEGDDAQSAGKTDEERDDVENECKMLRSQKKNKTTNKFDCAVCQQKFSNSGALERHLKRRHPEESPHDTYRVKYSRSKKLSPLITDKDSQSDRRRGKKHKASVDRGFWETDIEEEKYKCLDCDRVYKTKKCLREHEKVHTGDKRYICQICNKSFCFVGALKEHQLTHTDERPHECDTCGRGFRQRVHLKRHIMAIHLDEKHYTCDICNKKFYTQNLLATHQRVHTGEKPYVCDVCGKSYRERRPFERHMGLVHPATRPFACNVCFKAFTTKRLLINHGSRHIGKTSNSCRVCQKQLPPGKLEEHMRSHWKSKHACSVCKRVFLQSSQLAIHESSHTGKRPYSCDVCDKRFAHEKRLSMHMEMHFGSRKYECDVCDKKFSLSGGLAAHKLVHTGERPFPCPVCNRGFNSSANLKRHMLLYSGEKSCRNMTCETCNICNLQVTNMTRHMRYHEEGKLLECELCSKIFHTRANLKRHMMVHTGEKPYSCKLCGRSFAQSHNFKTHKCIGADDDSKLRCLKQNKENACTAAPQLFSTVEKATGTILTETKPYMCNICGIEDKNVTGLAKHIIEEHMEGEEYPCTPCQLALKPVNSERNHLKSHFETDIFMCTVCNKTFESEPLAEDHMQIHEVLNAPDHDASEELKYMCHVCGRSFMYEYHLNKHINVHSNVEKYSCDFCKKKYVSKDKFQKHECRRRRHVCDYCQKDFSTPRTLRVHIRSHTGEKPFLCTFCHKQFTQLITLKQHERMHTGEKRYKCDVCAKRFINAGNLKLHKRVHTSERPYSCDICKRSFGRKGNLVRHLLIDKCSKSSMKYITCEICKKQVSDKKKHMQLHYENKMLGCTICNKLYDSVQKLKRHKMMVHDKDKVYS